LGNYAAGAQENSAPSQSAIGEKSLATDLRGTIRDAWRLPVPGGEETLLPSQNVIGEINMVMVVRTEAVLTAQPAAAGNHLAVSESSKGKRPVSQAKCDW
jgi:hypothetical protein